MLTNLFSDPAGFLINILYMLPALLIGLSFHEFAHAWAAVKMGDNTPRFMGRLTLDPFKHIDPVGALCLLLVGFGWAKPVMVNPRNFKNYRKGELLVSLAGVTMNLLLAIFFTFIYALLLYLGVVNEVLMTVLFNIIVVNLALMAFNLLPIPPLDGYRVLKVFLWNRAHRFFNFCDRYGTYILIAVLLLGAARSVIAFVAGNLMQLLFNLFGSLFGLL